MDDERRLGRYELIARLASGGMGEIFLGRLEGAAGFEKLFAIKRVLPQFAAEAKFRKMLVGEAQIAAKMAHPNICQVYELGETAGQLYIVMEYLEGATLLALLRACAKRETRLELGFVAAVAAHVTDALHYAHGLHVIHRDISPANVFVCESGTTKLLDFGIAKVKDASVTQTDTVKGKYAYMAPEQLRGEAIDQRADIFALGVVLYEMLALRRLFQRQTDYLTFDALLDRPIPDLRRFRPDLPDAIAQVVATALDRDPARRFATARQFGAALADALGPAWSPTEVGELVRRTLIAERERERRAVAQAMVAPARLDAPPIAAYDEDEFPVIETVPDEPPALVAGEARTVVERRPRPTPVVPAPVRRRRFPGYVIGAVVLAGGGVTAALVLDREAPAPSVVVEHLDSPAGEPTRESDLSAVAPHTRALAACAARHPVAIPTAIAKLAIARDGTPHSLELVPQTLEREPLGSCLRAVLLGIRFAPRATASLFSLDIRLPTKRP